MQSREEIRAIIDTAIREKRAVWMRYRNMRREVRERTAEPLEWVADYKFSAWCHIRDGEVNFVISGVQEIRLAENVDNTVNDGGQSQPLPDRAYTPTPPAQVRTSREEFQLATPTVDRIAPAISRTATAPLKPAGEPFSEIANDGQWKRLMQYYIECLSREFQQQYIINSSSHQHIFFPLDPPSARDFVAGKARLSFPAQDKQSPNRLHQFVFNREYQNAQLCVGYPMLILGPDDFVPLVFAEVHVTVDERNQTFSFTAQDHEVSFAALNKLQFSESEITTVMEECQELVGEDDENRIGIIEGYLLKLIENLIAQPLARYQAQQLTPAYTGDAYYALYESPCLFWVTGNSITGNLIEELKELSTRSWNTIPKTIKSLLNQLPEQHYPDLTALRDDSSVYISSTNEQQRRAVNAARQMTATIVTGPPGSGKSQLVVNTLADAVMRGERALFTSRNNGAVDVVIDRLREGNGFKGVVRTGWKSIRYDAALKMLETLDDLGTMRPNESSAELQSSYTVATKRLLEIQDKLNEHTNTHQRIQDAEQQLEEIRYKLNSAVEEKALHSIPVFRQNEYEHLLDLIASLLASARDLQQKKASLEATMRVALTDNHADHPLLDAIKEFETRWGRFGGGLLHRHSFATLGEIREHVEIWLNVLPAFSAQYKLCELRQTVAQRFADLDQIKAQLPAAYAVRVPILAGHTNPDVIQRAAKVTYVWHQKALRADPSQSPSLLKRLIGKKDNAELKKLAHKLGELERKSGLPHIDSSGPDAVIDRANHLANLFHACELYIQAEAERKTLEQAQTDYARLYEPLPANIREDLTRLQTPVCEISPLEAKLKAIGQAAAGLESVRGQLCQRIDSRINLNTDLLTMLSDFKLKTGSACPQLWKLPENASTERIIQFLEQWQYVIACWHWQAVLTSNQSKLEALPSEDELHQKRDALQTELSVLGKAILNTIWLERVQATDTADMQHVRSFVHAFQGLNQPEYDKENWGAYREAQKEYLKHAIRAFPVWGTTNLTAKSSFPLETGLFDLVIIDEASQCDLVSALPLLYRAKRAMIIGDAKQLRHITTLSPETDRELCYRYGIDVDVYSYADFSLFDMALGSASPNPGYILLEEHYRSHPNIINFSNKAFYNQRLKIRTNMQNRQIPAAILENGCGIFWVHVPGEVEHPANGSALNKPEIMAVRSTLPRVLEAIDAYHWSASIGIVTPYRAQKSHLFAWVKDNYGERVLVGTAHTFQGDERDVLIYSPVLAPGISEGSQHWLERTDNLLNVAVTRARDVLIIVGDWDYCRSLPTSSIYWQLADYVAAYSSNAPFRSLDELPLFGQTHE